MKYDSAETGPRREGAREASGLRELRAIPVIFRLTSGFVVAGIGPEIPPQRVGRPVLARPDVGATTGAVAAITLPTVGLPLSGYAAGHANRPAPTSSVPDKAWPFSTNPVPGPGRGRGPQRLCRRCVLRRPFHPVGFGAGGAGDRRGSARALRARARRAGEPWGSPA